MIYTLLVRLGPTTKNKINENVFFIGIKFLRLWFELS